ncbi:MAG: hypothetical protein PHR77_13905 [Kiritimatiellae bacterium]|nr:hypothetical protein [Kiritimatiellia bacterium]MDD5521351.1 hypothetical protein [Kiritimatiellia bacterium]
MKTFITLAIILAANVTFSQPQKQNNFLQSVVQVQVTSQEYDTFLPWQKKNPSPKIGYGVAVSSSEVITTENLIRNNTLIELRKASSGEKIPATVVMSDEQANLAILKIADNSNENSLLPVQFADSLSRTDDVSILQFDETAQIQRGKAQIVQVSIRSLPSAPYPTLAFTILTDVNINGEGSPVLRDGKLAGLIISYDRGSRTGNMLPYVTLKHFLSDVRQSPYKGFASAGFLWAPLIDPAKRKYHKVNHANKGILVLDCLLGSGASMSLLPNDVILKWDNYSIDNLGFYEDPDFGRLAFPYLIMGRRSPGDTVPLKIVRNGEEKNITVKLTRRSDIDALVGENVTREREEYIVEGGFIIRELSGAYLQAYGQDWQKNVDPRLVNIYLTKKFHPEKEGDKVVILAGVLPNPINIGYQHFRDDIITKVNGKHIRNLADVFRILKDDGSIKRLSLQSMDIDLVLDQSMLSESNDNLAQLYRIPRLRFQHRKSK